MRPNALKEKLRRGQPAIGAFCPIPSPDAAEIMGILGMDFIIVDCEHGPMTPETATHMFRAAESRGLSTMTRVGENSQQVIQKYLDAGTQGIQIPLVNTVEQARQVVDAARYPPLGKRGLAGNRPSDYGLADLTDYVRRSNEETIVCVQIETQEAVTNMPAILEMPEIDIVFFGPTDFSTALGVPGQTRHPEVIALIERLGRQVIQSGKVAGTLARDATELKRWKQQGFLYLCTGVPALLARGIREHLADAREA